MECVTLCLEAAYCDSFNLFRWGWNDLYQGPVILILLFKGWWLLWNPIRTKWRHCHILRSVWGSSVRRDGSLLQYGHYKWDINCATAMLILFKVWYFCAFKACSLTGYHMIPDSTNFISVSPGSYGSLTDQAIDECRNQCDSRKGKNLNPTLFNCLPKTENSVFADCIAWIQYFRYYDNYPNGSPGHSQNHARCVTFKAMGYLTKNTCVSNSICIDSHIEIKNCSIHLNPSLLWIPVTV